MLIDFFGDPAGQTMLLALAAVYLLVESVLVYDMRLLQAAQGRFTSAVALRARGLRLPAWISTVHAAGWLLLVSIAVLNWRFAVALYLILYALRILPVLEHIGEILARPLLVTDLDAAQRELDEKLAQNEAELAKARQDWEETIHLMAPGGTLADFTPAFPTWWLRSENQDASLADALERYVDEHDLYIRVEADEPERITVARSILKVLQAADLSFEGDDDVLLEQYKTSLEMRVRSYEARTGRYRSP